MSYKNIDATVRPSFGRTLKWAVVDKVAGKRRRSPRGADIPTETSPPILTADTDAVAWLGHATAWGMLDGVSFMTDPVFSTRLGPGITRNVAAPFPMEATPKVDLVVISHNHRDHLDKASICAIEASHRPRYVTPHGVDRYLKQWRIPAERITTLGWWDTTVPVGDVSVTLVPAQHWSQRGAFDRNKTLWGGFVFQGGGKSLYFAGDTGYFDGFSDIGDRFPNLDLALLPIGAYDPEWFMSPQHMNPEDAGQAFIDLAARRMLAIHWGTFKLTDEPLDEPPERLDAWTTEQRIEPERRLILPIGGQTAL